MNPLLHLSNPSRFLAATLVCLAVGLAGARSGQAQDASGKLHIICFGAHPDDCEIEAGGSAAMWAAKGHKVKFVSVTNGDIGHWREAGGPLARRRTAEVEAVAKALGITTQVLDIHDGEFMPTLENRRTIIRLIREWDADIVISHRPNDYHPDHRYSSVAVQDAAYMVTVPFICPDAAPMKKNPVFLYFPDSFKKPNPFTADVAVAIDPVIEKKLDALALIVSQFYEGGANGDASLLPAEPDKQKARHQKVREEFAGQFRRYADRFRPTLTEFYGESAAKKVQYAEAFEICEYGERPDQDRLKQLFPIFTP